MNVPSTRARLEQLLSQRILILDGAMGTLIQRRGLEEADFRGERFRNHDRELKGDNEILCLSQPGVISEIHHEYLDAGADVLSTNTFSANRVSQADYGLEDVCLELNREAARLAREACDAWTAKTPERPRFVAGAIGPTNKSLSSSNDVNDPSKREIGFDD